MPESREERAERIRREDAARLERAKLHAAERRAAMTPDERAADDAENARLNRMLRDTIRLTHG